MKTLKELNLTELETSFVLSLIPKLYAEPNFTDVELKDISAEMKVTMDTAKGVLGSLVKKGICTTQLHSPSTMKLVGKKMKWVVTKYEFVILHEDYYHLHPNWK